MDGSFFFGLGLMLMAGVVYYVKKMLLDFDKRLTHLEEKSLWKKY